MGFWDSYWEWLYADEETFIDLKKGIYYTAHGKTRSVKGLFKNFDLKQLGEALGSSSARAPELEDRRRYREVEGIRIYDDRTASCRHGGHRSICRGCVLKLMEMAGEMAEEYEED